MKASDLPEHLRKRLGIPAKSKYGVSNRADRTCDGITFDSKAEMKRYMELCQMKLAGQVKYFLRQVPFHLPGGVVYRADFMVVNVLGGVAYEDVKGCRTKEYILKKKMVEALYPVVIREVRM